MSLIICTDLGLTLAEVPLDTGVADVQASGTAAWCYFSADLGGLYPVSVDGVEGLILSEVAMVAGGRVALDRISIVYAAGAARTSRTRRALGRLHRLLMPGEFA